MLTKGAQPTILCVMRMPPDLDGHGGSQRAWHLLEGLRQLGKVHFVLIYRQQDRDCCETSLDPILPLVESVTRIEIPEWRGAMTGRLVVWRDLVTLRSHEAPRLSERQLEAIAEKLPIHHADLIFAGRLCSAVIVQDLLKRNLVSGDLLLSDYDDIMSKFRRRQIQSDGKSMGLQRRTVARIDAHIIKQHEADILAQWDGVAVCTYEDIAELARLGSQAALARIPNIAHRDLLPPRKPDGRFRILFIGNLAFRPNVQGLISFMESAWPTIKRELPQAELAIVGLNPLPEVEALADLDSVSLYANVPSVLPYYEGCDVTIAPITFGSGTRIKILEAMALGRPVVSTSLGAEGMELEDGRHILIGDTMEDFAQRLIELAKDPQLASEIADNARLFQQEMFGPGMVNRAISEFVDAAKLSRSERKREAKRVTNA